MPAHVIRFVIAAFAMLAVILLGAPARAQTPPPKLDENCVINVLNRTVQVSHDGGWVMPNVPSNMGQVRARATCTQGTQTVSGETDYFNVTTNGITNVGTVQFANADAAVPVSLAYTEGADIVLTAAGATHQLALRATYPDGSVRDVGASGTGTNYSSTNAGVASVDADGVVTAHSSGTVLITARKDEVVAFKQVTVSVGGDQDHDGLPDDYEIAHGLNPNDPIDAQEDQDGDGLTALQEFHLGTDPRNPDTDGDGLSDGEEVTPGADGFITNPLSADTDGDGLNDRLEVLAGSSPVDPKDHNLAAVLDRISVTPASLTLTFNSIDTEVSGRIAVTGILIDGSTIDLTGKRTGTTYMSSDLNIASFGSNDGEIFGGTAGNATITIANAGKQFVLPVTVVRFQPKALSAIDIPGYANNVDVSGNFAYVAAGDGGFVVVDVTNRSHPAIVSTLDTHGTAIDVRVVGNLAYVAAGTGGLKIIDVSTPQAPQLVSTADTAGIAQDLKVQDQIAYVADGANGVEIFDVKDPVHPVHRGHLDGIGTAKGIDVEGSRAVVVADSSLYVLDVANPAAPILLGSVNIGAVKDVVMQSGYAYVAAYENGYRVVRISDPAHPVVTGGGPDFVPHDVELSDGLAFFAEQLFPNVIALLNVRDPEHPVFQSTIDLSPLGDFAGTGIALDGNYAYVTEQSFVVIGDFGTSGITKLFIAQYRDVSDTGGVPPTVQIHAPSDSPVEGGTFVVDIDAQDDVGVREVSLTLDGVLVGTDTSRPFEIPVTIPLGHTSATLEATAIDFGNNVASAHITLPVLPDSDRDGLADERELTVYHTDPHNPDTDGDGLSDGREVALGTNPLVADTDGDGLTDLQEVNADTDPLNPDVTPPLVVATDPPADATNIPENHAITITFNEPMLARSIIDSVVQLTQNGGVFPGTARLMPNGTDLVFTPTSLLNDFTSYDVTVSGVRDRAGNPLAQPFHFRYTTGNFVDTSPPQIVTSNPPFNATGVPTNTILSVLLNEPVDPTSVTGSTVILRDGNTFANIAGVVSLAADAQTVTFTPNTSLAVHHSHTLFLSGVKDLFGNAMSASISFTAAFAPDGTAPQILNTSIADQQTAVPTNATVAVLFDEAINPFTLANIELRQGATVVSTQRQVNGTQVKLIPSAPLTANTSYTLNIGAVSDLSGNVLAQSRIVSFTTGAGQDTTSPTLVSSSPIENATNVPRNSVLEVRLSKPINPVTLIPGSVGLRLQGDNRAIPGTLGVSADRKSILFTPASPLAVNTSYNLVVTFSTIVEDVSGHRFDARIDFTTGADIDTTPPVVQLSSLADGATGIPVNGRFALQFDGPLADRCVNPQTVQVTSGGATVAGTLSLSADHRTLTFAPQTALTVNTAYTVHLQGVCDLAGNTFSDFVSTFTTGASAAADTTKPTVTIVPAQNATNVSVSAPIVLTFSESMDVTTLAGSLHALVGPNAIEVPGTLSVAGTTVTFTPLAPFPGNTAIAFAVNGAADLAGNVINPVTRNFTTGTPGDTTPPKVLSMVPNDGLIDVAVTSSVVLTLSEPVDPGTLTGNVAMFVNGNLVTPLIAHSTDNRTIMLTSSLPASSVVSVILTNGVRDLSGNPLTDFVGAFTTTTAADATAPTVIAQFPGNAATNAPANIPIVLFVSEPLNPATAAGAMHVSQNAVLVPGTVTVSADGRSLTMRPTQPLASNATIEVFLDNTATDTSGNPLSNYQGSFRVIADSAASPPQITGFGPSFGDSTIAVPVNAVLDTLVTEPLDPGTVSSADVRLTDFQTGAVIAADVTLIGEGQIIRVRPQGLLTPLHSYSVNVLSGVKDLSGQLLPATTLFFSTSSAAVADTVAPRVLSMSPTNGSSNIPVNAGVTAQFDEPINSFTIASVTQQRGFASLLWSGQHRQLRFVRFQPYATGTQVTESVAAAEDFAGNTVTGAATTTFTTGSSADGTAPTLLTSTPGDGAQNVPVNAVLRAQFSEPLDPASIGPATVSISDNTAQTIIPSSATLEADGRTVTIVPTAALPVGRTVSLLFTTLRDLAGNPIFQFSNGGGGLIPLGQTFTTAFSADTQPPFVAATSVTDGLTGVATNALLQVQFNEPVNEFKLDGVTLRQQSGALAPATITLSADRSVATLKLVQPLAPNTTYVLSVTGVQDLSGNLQTQNRTVTFTTGARADLTPPVIRSSVPFTGATSVPVNTLIEIELSEPVNPIGAAQTIVLRDAASRTVPGQVTFPSATLMRFTPTQPLGLDETYGITVNGITDLAGNVLNNAPTITFQTGLSADDTPAHIAQQSIADGAVALPVNGRIALQFDAPLAEPCVNGQTVQLAAGGVTVAGTLSLSADRTRLTFIPQSPLATNTAYVLTLHGVCDVAGHVLGDFATGFTTSASSTPDTTGPTLTAVPAQGATNVPVTAPITLTFSEPFDVTTLSGVRVSVSGVGDVATTISVNGNVATVTPVSPLPGNKSITVSVTGVTDLAGNPNAGFSRQFTTGTGGDTTVPQVVSVSPGDGTVDVQKDSTSIVLTFSKSMNPATLTAQNIALFVNGQIARPGFTISADNRTVRMTTSLPAASIVSVIATGNVQDFSGNHLPDFVSAFTTAVDFDTSRPRVVAQFPGAGASAVRRNANITVYLSEPLISGTLPQAVHVSQNGTAIDGTVSVSGNGQTVVFRPNDQWAEGALVQINVDNTALDLQGNALQNYVGSFRVIDPAAIAPAAVNFSPRSSFSAGAPINSGIDVLFNAPLDPASISSTTVTLVGNSGAVPNTATLSASGLVLHVQPQVLLTPSSFYTFQVTSSARGTNGRAVSPVVMQLATNATTTPDTQPPHVAVVGPLNGATNVALNAQTHWRFDKPIDEVSLASVPRDTVSLFFSTDDRDLHFVRQEPYAANAQVTESLGAAVDYAGNALAGPASTTFTTGSTIDVVGPTTILTTPPQGVAVPVNSIIRWQFSESVDPASVQVGGPSIINLLDNATQTAVPVTLTLESDARTVRMTPVQPLTVNHLYRTTPPTVTDLAANALTDTQTLFLQTGAVTDTQPPTVSSSSVQDGQSSVATNALLQITFSEPIDPTSMTSVVLQQGGAAVPAGLILSTDRTSITLSLARPLVANAAHTLTVTGIRDLAGNVLAVPFTITFTTGAGAH